MTEPLPAEDPRLVIAGRVMSKIVAEHTEAAIELNLEILWEVIEVATDQALAYILGTKDYMINDDSPLSQRALIARSIPGVVSALSQDKKIVAIKELRAATRMGLKSAKDTIDAIAADYAPTKPAPF